MKFKETENVKSRFFKDRNQVGIQFKRSQTNLKKFLSNSKISKTKIFFIYSMFGFRSKKFLYCSFLLFSILSILYV